MRLTTRREEDKVRHHDEKLNESESQQTRKVEENKINILNGWNVRIILEWVRAREINPKRHMPQQITGSIKNHNRINHTDDEQFFLHPLFREILSYSLTDDFRSC